MRRVLFSVFLLGVAACKPDLGPGDSLVTSTRILAVRADPPEAAPGKGVTYSALVAGADGTVHGAPIVWSYCTAPKPIGENNAVSAACSNAASLVPAGAGPTIGAPPPKDACSRFGPDTPPGGFRPRDPDVTGGYYQPLRLDLDGADATFELMRVTCNLANAPPDVASAFVAAYTPNANPRLAPLGASVAGAPVALDAIRAGSRVSFEASWDASDAEAYAYYDIASEELVTKREAMRVAWYATGGAFDSESTGRAENDTATSTANGWTAPDAVGPIHAWVVLRDSRGGIAFASYEIAVVP